MTYLELLRQDLEDTAIVSSAREAKGDPVSASTRETLHQLRALRSELLGAGMSIAIVTSAANAFCHGLDTARGATVVHALCPRDMPLLSAATLTFSDRTQHSGLFDKFLECLARLRLAVALTDTWRQQGLESDQRSLLSPSALADGWRRTSKSVVQLNEALTEILVTGNAHQSTEIECNTLMLLERAANGECPCFENGELSIVGWAERRREVRNTFDRTVVVIVDGQSMSVRMVDISASGLGLQGPCIGQPGDIVHVKLSSHRTLKATIRWTYGDRTGLKFSAPLSSDDRLLNPR